MTFMTGGRARVVGVVRGEFTETIEGLGRVVGVRFRPGGFRPFLGAPVSGITDRFLPVEEIFGPAARAAADAIIAEPGTDEAVALAGGLPAVPRARTGPTPGRRGRGDRGPDRRRSGSPPGGRAGGGTGDRHRGACNGSSPSTSASGPKWVIRRYRMQEAADRAGGGADVDWAALAAELGLRRPGPLHPRLLRRDRDPARPVRSGPLTAAVSADLASHSMKTDQIPAGGLPGEPRYRAQARAAVGRHSSRRGRRSGEERLRSRDPSARALDEDELIARMRRSRAARHPVQDQRDRRGAGGRAGPARRRRVLHRNEPDRPGLRVPARCRGVQRAVLQHPQRRRARRRRRSSR